MSKGESLNREVEKLLQSTETLRKVFEIKRRENRKVFNRWIAIVTNGGETAVFFLKRGVFGGLQLRHGVPVLTTFSYRTTGEMNFIIEEKSRGQFFDCEALNDDDLQLLSVTLNQASKVAYQHDFSPQGTTHAWIAHYFPDSAEAKQLAVPAPAPAPSISPTGVYRGTFYNPSAEGLGQMNQVVRDNWIRKRMSGRKSEYTTAVPFKFFLSSYNVNGKRCKGSLKNWLSPAKDAHVVAIAFQEIIDLTAKALLVTENSSVSRAWEEEIEEEIGSDFVLIHSRQYVGVHLAVYIKKQHAEHVKGLQCRVCGCGIMGQMGNKGGVAIRFNIHDSDICFVGTHLASGLEHVDRRNSDFETIMRRIQFAPENESEPMLGILDHSTVFWLGDLNYRLDLPMERVKELIATESWPDLLQADQLMRNHTEGLVFKGFVEAPINFAPTYKYEVGTVNYDEKSEKKRAPAWCDRILWRVTDSSTGLAVVRYAKADLTISDHMPVVLEVTFNVQQVQLSRRLVVQKALMKELDSAENDRCPSLKVSQRIFHFADVRVLVPTALCLTIENDGQVPAKFSFQDDNAVAKPWLTVSPMFGLLFPGETIEIRLGVLVDQRCAPDLNSGAEVLESILVMHVEHGPDIFLSVQGEYLRSSFGNTLQQLVKAPNPMRTSAPSALARSLHIPKELWRMVDYIVKNDGLTQEGLFLNPGIPRELEDIRECLDTGQKFNGFQVMSMADALLQFLYCNSPVIPQSFHQQCADAVPVCAMAKLVLVQLPPVCFNVFAYLMSFLRLLLSPQNSVHNKLAAEDLAMIFGSALLPIPFPAGAANAESFDSAMAQKKADFVLLFLSSDVEEGNAIADDPSQPTAGAPAADVVPGNSTDAVAGGPTDASVAGNAEALAVDLTDAIASDPRNTSASSPSDPTAGSASVAIAADPTNTVAGDTAASTAGSATKAIVGDTTDAIPSNPPTQATSSSGSTEPIASDPSAIAHRASVDSGSDSDGGGEGGGGSSGGASGGGSESSGGACGGGESSGGAGGGGGESSGGAGGGGGESSGGGGGGDGSVGRRVA